MKVAFITDKADFQFDLYSLCALRMAKKKPERKIAVFFNGLGDSNPALEYPSNLVLIQIEKHNENINPISRYFQLLRLKKQIKKFNPDLVFFQKENFIKDRWKSVCLLNPYPQKSTHSVRLILKKADNFLVYRHYTSHAPISHRIPSEKTIYIDPVFFHERRIEQNNKSFREKNMGDHDFFLLYTDNIDNAVSFLKGFSQFKQWQKSQIRLCLVVEKAIEKDLAKKLENYKFRESVFLMTQTADISMAISEAFGNFIWNREQDVSSLLLLAASVKNPLFLPDNPEWRQLFEDKADFFENKEKSIFSAMTQVYKETIAAKERAANREHFFLLHDTHSTLIGIEKLLEP